ncbi:hypothetical protein CC79DRAFT_1031456 [Sarocladium strictum]
MKYTDICMEALGRGHRLSCVDQGHSEGCGSRWEWHGCVADNASVWIWSLVLMVSGARDMLGSSCPWRSVCDGLVALGCGLGLALVSSIVVG